MGKFNKRNSDKGKPILVSFTFSICITLFIIFKVIINPPDGDNSQPTQYPTEFITETTEPATQTTTTEPQTETTEPTTQTTTTTEPQTETTEPTTETSTTESETEAPEPITEDATIEPVTEANFVWLDELKVTETDDCFYKVKSAQDTIGTEYSTHFFESKLTFKGENYITYYLGGKYKIFSGTIAVSDETIQNHTSRFCVYCDDERVYETESLGRATAPFEFSINVEGKQWLKLSHIKETEADYWGSKQFISGDNDFVFIYSNFKLEK